MQAGTSTKNIDETRCKIVGVHCRSAVKTLQLRFSLRRDCTHCTNVAAQRLGSTCLLCAALTNIGAKTFCFTRPPEQGPKFCASACSWE